MKSVSLENYDGYSFERLCAEILEKAGYGKAVVTQQSGDGGKDIIITTPKGETIYVECKKYGSSNSVGRPIVQKFDSAMRVDGVQYGMIITTSKFSPEAEEYVNQNNLPIQLIDLPILSSIATKGGIQIYQNQVPITVSGYEIPKKINVENCIRNYIKTNYDSKPIPAEKLIQFHNGYVKINPVYECHYDLDYSLTTSNRVLKHDCISDGRLLIDGITGNTYPDSLRLIYENTQRIEYDKLDSDKWNGNVENFQINETTLRQYALDFIKNKHSATIDYYGGNNVRYSKSGEPSNKDIEIYNLEQIYIPNIQTTVKIKNKDYTLNNCYCNGTDLFIPNILNTCGICGKKIEHGVICNDCGSLVHPQRKLDSHSFVCDVCGKTICRKCTYIYRGKHLCLDCAKKTGNNYSHISQEMNQKIILSLVIGFICVALAVVLTVFLSIAFALILFIALIIFIVIIYSGSYYSNSKIDEHLQLKFKK